jgi:hypothetical protein
MPSIANKIIAVVVVVSSLTSCRTPGLSPRLILQTDPVGREFWLAAPYVLAVKIVSASQQGSPEPIFQGGPKTLQLLKFDASVENLIKGDLPGNVTFFFFAKLDQKPSYFLEPGKRYIVSLRSEGGVLRSWADATQLMIRVRSGSHSQKELPLELGPEATIAYILLTPGSDVDLREFGNSLTWPYYGDPAYVNQLLKQLELSPDQTLRDSACLSTASMFWIRPKCLEQVLSSPDANAQKAAAGFLKDDVNLPERLRANPFFQSPQHWTDYSTQMLEIYSEDMRPEVRKAACASLRSFAPERAVEHCRGS